MFTDSCVLPKYYRFKFDNQIGKEMYDIQKRS